MEPAALTCAYLDWFVASGTQNPVVRVFGTLRGEGKKAVLYVHGTFPYFYCHVPNYNEAAGAEAASLVSRLEQLLHSAHLAVRRVTLVTDKIPAYGYHDKTQPCFRVDMRDPMELSRTVRFLDRAGFTIFEAHLSYVLQFMVDFNLYGMDWISFRRATLRERVAPPSMCVFSSWASNVGVHFKNAYTNLLEFDVNAGDIVVGAHEPTPGSLAARHVKYVPSLVSWWEAEARRRRAQNPQAMGDPSDEGALEFEASPTQENRNTPNVSQRTDDFGYYARYADLVHTLSVSSASGEDGRLSSPALATKRVREDAAEVQTSPHPVVRDMFYSPPPQPDQLLSQESEELVQAMLRRVREGLHETDFFSAEEYEASANNDNNNNKPAQNDDEKAHHDVTQMSDAELLSQADGLAGEDSNNANNINEDSMAQYSLLFSSSSSDSSSGSSSSSESDSDGNDDDGGDDNSGGARKRAPRKRKGHRHRAQMVSTEEKRNTEWHDIYASNRKLSHDSRVSVGYEGVEGDEEEEEEEDVVVVVPEPQATDAQASPPRATFGTNDVHHKTALTSSTPPFLDPPRLTPNARLAKLRPQHLFYSDPADCPERIPGKLDQRGMANFVLPTTELESVAALWPDNNGSNSNKHSTQPPPPHAAVWLEPRKQVPPMKARYLVRPWSQQQQQPPPQQQQQQNPESIPSTPATSNSNTHAPTPFSAATPGNPTAPTKRTLRTAMERSKEPNHMRILALEILTYARHYSNAGGEGKPFAPMSDPDRDAILAVFYLVQGDDESEDELGVLYTGDFAASSASTAATAVAPPPSAGPLPHDLGAPCVFPKSCRVNSETDLLEELVRVMTRVDPDLVMSWEMQRDSLGYVFKRAAALGMATTTLPRRLSRMPFGAQDRRHDRDEFGAKEHSGFWLPGRHLLNMWRVCREFVRLTTYSLSNVLERLTGTTLAVHSARTLVDWWENQKQRHLVTSHFKQRLMGMLRVCHHLDVIGRSSELARLFGIDFFSVLTRGSQFRVEAVLARVAKRLNFLLLSPNRKNVEGQRAMEAVPLIMEPQSRFFASPVVVLDFRSLYPSVIIAHNICYTTCLGKMKRASSPSSSGSPEGARGSVGAEFETGLGGLPSFVPPVSFFSRAGRGEIDQKAFISPNGVAFVSKAVREGILPRMLQEILDSRVMIKKSVEHEPDESKRRVADSRQFGLKMIANVTYGYTAASFSGRMPCSEIADAIVQTGRAALEKAIVIVNALSQSEEFGPLECVYGDTDSLFVHCPGKDLNEARTVGRVISERVSAALPKPMKLQFEKVYLPCVLEVKKRYVGLKFPSAPPSSSSACDGDEEGDEEQGHLDAKGIETIRRDGCPAVVKAMEWTLHTIFKSRDLSKVKRGLRAHVDRMFQGQASLGDFILTGKVKLGSYARDRKPKRTSANYPPAAIVALKHAKRDHMARPLYKERVPYVVVCGGPKARLIDLVMSPHEFLAASAEEARYQLNVGHYVDKLVLPALARLLCVAGVDVRSWFGSIVKSKSFFAGWRKPRAVPHEPSPQLLQSLHPYHYRHPPQRSYASRLDAFVAWPCVLCSKPAFSRLGSRPPQQQLPQHAVPLCRECWNDTQRAVLTADVVRMVAEREAVKALTMCSSCVGTRTACLDGPAQLACTNLDCEGFFARKKALARLRGNFGLEDVGDYVNETTM